MDWQEGERVELTADDAIYVVSMLDSIGSKLASAQGPLVPLEKVSITAIDLDALAQSMFGITDPIGQLKSWLSDQLKSVSSWIASNISSVVRSLWDSYISPALSALSRSFGDVMSSLHSVGDAVSRVLSAVSGIPSAVVSSISGFFDSLARSISSVLSAIGSLRDAVAGMISSAVSSIVSSLRGALDSISSSIGGVASALSSGFSALQSAVGGVSRGISGLADALSSGFRSLLDLLGRVPALVGEVLSPALRGLQDALQSGLQFVVENLTLAFTGVVSRSTESLLSALGGLGNVLGSAVAAITDGISRAASGLGDLISRSVTALADLTGRVLSAVSTMSSMFLEALNSMGSSVVDALSRAAGGIMSGLEGLGRALSSFAQQATDFLSGLASRIQAGFSELGKLVSAVAASIGEALRPVMDSIGRGFGELGKLLSMAMDSLKQLGAILTGFVNGILQLPGLLQNAFSGFFNGIIGGLTALANAFTSFLKDPLGALKAAIDWLASQLWNLMPEWMRKILDAAGRFFENVLKGYQEFFRDPLGYISRAFQELGRWIWERLPDWLRNALDAAGRALESLRRAIDEFMKDPWGSISRAFQELGGWIWERLPEPVKGFLSWLGELAAKAGQVLWELFTVHIPGFFRWVWEGIQAFIKDPLGFLYNNVLLPLWNGLQWLWNEIYKRLPDWVRSGIDMVVRLFTEQIPAFLRWLWEGFQAFIKDPIGFLQKYIIQPFVDWIKRGLQWLWEQVGNFLAALTGAMKTIADATMSAAAGLGLGLAASAAGVVSGALGSLLGIAQSVSDAAKTVFKQVAERMAREAAKWYSDVYRGILGQAGVASPEFLKIGAVDEALTWAWVWSLMLFTEPLWGRMVGNMLGWGLKKTGAMISGFTPRASAGGGGRGGVSARGHARGKMEVGVPAGPSAGGSGGASGGADASLGASVRFSFDIGRAIGGAFWTFGDEISSYATELGRALQYGLGIWLGRVYVAPVVYYLRNLAPLYVPPEYFWVEVVRRFTPHPQAKEMEKVARLYMGFGGWSDFFTDLVMMEAGKLNIVVRDRFQRPRAVPLALRYVLPSVYDAAAMMVRDAFADPQDFIKLAEALGIYRDVAVFYALLRYRYPAPADLARFYWRGVVGMLWSPGLPKEAGSLQALGLGYDPAAPKALNLKADVLNRMIASYLRWQDYFPLAWEKGFAADIDVYHELTADIPTKIDSRWMMKWGIFEHLAALGATIATPVEELAGLLAKASGKELLRTRVEKGLTVDVTMLARLIEATGMHPYWVPLIAVAEGINAVADEKTMVRTSIITMYKEGLISLDSTEALLSGALVQSVLTGYIDPATGKPVTFTYRMPVVWLPIERRLMQMKAVADRVVDLFRDLSGVIARAVRLRVYRAGEAVEAFKRAVQMAQRHLLDELGRLTDVPIQLGVDENYLRFYAEVQEVVSDVEISIFLRTMAQRLLGWILMRVAYGYVRESDFAELLDALVKGFRLTPAEAEAIRGLFSVLYKVAAREMIPTPSQLGTFAEYMVVPPDVVARVLAEHRVPSEYWDLWMRYIQVKPLKSDYRSLLTAAARAYRRRALSREEWERLLSEARQFGFTDTEIALLRRRVDLELVSAGTEEYVPPLSTLASMVEYIDVSPELIAQVLQARGVVEPWASLWTRYVMTRSIASEVNTLVSTFRRIYEYFTMPEEFMRRMMDLMRAGGWTVRELEVFQLDLELRKAYRIMSTLIPTVRQFVGDALYIGDWERLFDDLMRARGVDVQKYKEQVEYYKRLIKSRKMARRISWYITRVTNAATYGVLSLEEARARLERLKQYGLDDDEINLILDGIQLQIAYTEARRG
ncbi:MAG: hypothetical protein QW075_01420 [Thermofilaceae archaeon]